MKQIIIALSMLAATAAFAEGCSAVFYVTEGNRVLTCQTCYGVTTCN